MANYVKPLYSVLEEILTDIKNRHNDPEFNEILVYFFAAVCRFNENRNRTSIDDKEKGFEGYRSTVSGPCYELFNRFLVGDKPGISLSMVSTKHVKKKADEIYDKYFTKSDEIKFRYTDPDTDKDLDLKPPFHIDYEGVLNCIKEKGINKNSKKSVIPTDLIISCCNDLKKRISRYNLLQRKRAQQHYYKSKAEGHSTSKKQFKQREEIHKETNVTISIDSGICRNVIHNLNSEYEEANEEIKSRLKKILIPVYSDSPYFALCIAHKNRLPYEIYSECARSREDIEIINTYKSVPNFVFAIIALTYDISNSDKNRKYAITQNVVTKNFLLGFEFLDNDVASDNRATINGIQIAKYYSKKIGSEKRICADDYDFMMKRYEDMCKDLERVFMNVDTQDKWFPLELPGNTYNKLSFMFEDPTGNFKLQNLIREYKEPEETENKVHPELDKYEKNVNLYGQTIKEIKEMIKNGKCTLDEIAKKFNVPIEKVELLARQVNLNDKQNNS